MSKPAPSSIFETDFFKAMDFTKMMDFSKTMGDFKWPAAGAFNMEPIMAAGRKNIEAFTALNQAVLESYQSLAQRQAELARQAMADASGVMTAIMSAPSPQEKVIKQAEASKAAVEKYLANARDISETVSKVNHQAMETVSSRLSESLNELRGIITSKQEAA